MGLLGPSVAERRSITKDAVGGQIGLGERVRSTLLGHESAAATDATRRDILRRSVRGERSVSRLAEAYPMSFAAVQKHVAVLERAGLVTKERRGREQLVHTSTDAVHRAHQALDQLETAWRGRVDRMSALLAQDR